MSAKPACPCGCNYPDHFGQPAESDDEGLKLLFKNLEALRVVFDDVREELGQQISGRFYHAVLLEAAEFIPAEVFARCLESAREQMRRPL